MQKAVKINTVKLSQQIANMEDLSKKNGWSYSYDPELDSLYFTSKKVDKGFRLFSINNELSIYIDKNSDLGGVFIEYYNSNLASHDEKFKPFADLFTKKNENTQTISVKDMTTRLLLSEVIKAELLSNLVNLDEKRYSLPVD